MGKRARRGGRPTKLTPTVCKAIAAHVEKGNFLNTAAALERVSSVSASTWMSRGRKERERIEAGESPDPDEARYLEFLCAIENARAIAESKYVDVILRCAEEGDRKAAEFYLTHACDSWKPNAQPAADHQPDSLNSLVAAIAKAREQYG